MARNKTTGGVSKTRPAKKLPRPRSIPGGTDPANRHMPHPDMVNMTMRMGKHGGSMGG